MISQRVPLLLLVSLSLASSTSSVALAQLPGQLIGPPKAPATGVPVKAMRASVARANGKKAPGSLKLLKPTAVKNPICICHEASSLYDEGHYGRSKELYLQYISTLKVEQGDNGYDVGRMYKNVALCCSQLNDNAGADLYIGKALAIMQSNPSERIADVAEMIATQADFASDRGQLERSLKLGAQAVAMLEKAKVGGSDEYAYVLSIYGYALQESDKPEAAARFYTRSIAMYKAQNDDKDSENGAILMGNLGNIYLERGSYTKAHEWYQRRFDFEMDEEKPVAENIERAASQLANLHFKQNHFIKAGEAYQIALGRLEKAFAATSKEVRSLSKRAGDALVEKQCYQAASVFYEKVLPSYGEQAQSKKALASALNDVAFAYFKGGLYEKAKPAMERVLSLLDPKAPGDRSEYACAQENYQKLLAAMEKRHSRTADSDVDSVTTSI